MENTTTLEIPFPADFVALLSTQHQAAATAREHIILGLFQEDRISGGMAAELLGLTWLGFVALLARKGIPLFRLTVNERAKEVAFVNTWRADRV